MLSWRTRKVYRWIWFYALLCLVCVLVVFPFYWMILSSMTPQQIFDPAPSLFTTDVNLQGYVIAFVEYPLARWLTNSFLVAVVSAFFAIVISLFAAYSLSRFNYPGKFVFTMLLLTTQMIPFALLIIPLYIIFRDVGLLNSLLGLVIAYVTFSIPLCTLLLKGFLDTIPVQIEESALVDGCTRIGAFLRVTLPIAVPGLAVTSLFAFLQAWNEYVFAATLVKERLLFTTSVGLYYFLGEYTADWITLLAAAVVVTIPTFVVFVFLQKGLVKGLGTGALKG